MGSTCPTIEIMLIFWVVEGRVYRGHHELPIQNHALLRETPQIYHRFALFEPPKCVILDLLEMSGKSKTYSLTYSAKYIVVQW